MKREEGKKKGESVGEVREKARENDGGVRAGGGDDDEGVV